MKLLGAGAVLLAMIIQPRAQEQSAVETAILYLPLSEGLKHVAKMEACRELWNKNVAGLETNSNDGSGKNLDYSSSLLSPVETIKREGDTQILSHTYISSTKIDKGVCGWFVLVGPGRIVEKIAVRRDLGVLYSKSQDIAADYNAEQSAGRSPPSDMVASYNKRFDQYVDEEMRRIEDALGGESSANVHFIIHDPNSDVVADAGNEADILLRKEETFLKILSAK